MSHVERANLGNRFRRYFRVDAALDDALRDLVYLIRHQVYCEQLRFEPERPSRRESDEYDTHSLHCLMRTVGPTPGLVGCARLVQTDPNAPDAPLPFERTCAQVLDRSIIDPARLPRRRIAEVSRLAVCARYRRRKGETREEGAVHGEDFRPREHARFPYIPVGLYMAAVSLARHTGIDTLFMLAEPRLVRHFARLGVNIRQIGGPVEHRGRRVPCMMDVSDVVRNIRRSMRPLWREVDAEIVRSLGSRKANGLGQ